MQSLTHSGLTYRTKLLTLEKAASFARCIGSNDTFTAVAIEESEKARSERKFFVTFLPSNPERAAEMVQREQDARQQRAETEGAAYVFCLDKDAGRPFHWCFNPASGETYEATPEVCSCPDWEFRCREQGLKCKHQLRLLQVLPAAAPVPAPTADPSLPYAVRSGRVTAQQWANDWPAD